jgi:hypothetical protein
MEIDIEDVPWKDDLVSKPPVIEAGELLIPITPGWGVEINENVIRAHPPARLCCMDLALVASGPVAAHIRKPRHFPGTALPCRSNTTPNTAITSPGPAIGS